MLQVAMFSGGSRSWRRERKHRVCISGKKVRLGISNLWTYLRAWSLDHYYVPKLDISSRLDKFADDSKMGRIMNGVEDCQSIYRSCHICTHTHIAIMLIILCSLLLQFRPTSQCPTSASSRRIYLASLPLSSHN